MTSDANGWPDASKPGVPLNPERAGWHWLATSSGTPFAARWEPKYYDSADEWEWRIDGTFDDIEDAARNYRYLGPILTPSEIAAREAAAWCAGRDAAGAVKAVAEQHRGVSHAQAVVCSNAILALLPATDATKETRDEH